MSENPKYEFFSSGQSWYWVHGMATVVTVVLLGLHFSPIRNYFQSGLLDPIMFNAREYLGKTPKISDRLKILALDDSSFSQIGGPSLEPEDLALLLQNISKKKPKAILIDALLSATPSGEDQKLFLDRLNAKLDKVYTGAYTSQASIAYRPPINLDHEAFKLSNYVDPSFDLFNISYNFHKKLDWNVYGHSKYYDGSFNSQGHITYNINGTISPFYMITPEYLIPHISLYSADSVKIEDDRLFANGKEVTLNNDGDTLINHRPPQMLYQKTLSLRFALNRARNGEDEKSIKEGDVVLILLAFATGNTDFHEGGPFGAIPGGLIIASMISDILQGTWLAPWELGPLMIVIFALIGALIGIHSNATWFATALPVLPAITTVLAIALFAYENIVIPWFLPSIAFSVTAILYFTHNRLQDELKLISLERNYFSEKALRLEESNKTAKLEGYLGLGKAVQNLLLPKKLSGTMEQIAYHMTYKPHLKMAGDWFYVWEVSETEKRFFIGDVMGKGPSAAIPVAIIVSTLKECEGLNLSSDECIQRINQRIIELFHYYITSSVSLVTIYQDGRCELFNCGSPPWFIYGQDSLTITTSSGAPLGISRELILRKKEITLRPNEVLFTFTDGYIEGTRGIRKLEKSLKEERNFIPRADYIEERLDEISIVENNEDDQSLLAISLKS